MKEIMVGLIALIVCFVGMIKLEQIRCVDSAAIMETEYRFGLTTGCFVKKGQKWVPLDSVRAVEE